MVERRQRQRRQTTKHGTIHQRSTATIETASCILCETNNGIKMTLRTSTRAQLTRPLLEKRREVISHREPTGITSRTSHHYFYGASTTTTSDLERYSQCSQPTLTFSPCRSPTTRGTPLWGKSQPPVPRVMAKRKALMRLPGREPPVRPKRGRRWWPRQRPYQSGALVFRFEPVAAEFVGVKAVAAHAHVVAVASVDIAVTQAQQQGSFCRRPSNHARIHCGVVIRTAGRVDKIRREEQIPFGAAGTAAVAAITAIELAQHGEATFVRGATNAAARSPIAAAGAYAFVRATFRRRRRHLAAASSGFATRTTARCQPGIPLSQQPVDHRLTPSSAWLLQKRSGRGDIKRKRRRAVS